MPRYFFHIQDDQTCEDAQGSLLADLEEAKKEALALASEILPERPSTFWDGGALVITVTNNSASALFSLTCTASMELQQSEDSVPAPQDIGFPSRDNAADRSIRGQPL